MRYYLLYNAVMRHPGRIAAFVFGALLPLLAAGLVLAPKTGGLSDSAANSAPPAFVVETFD